MVKINKEREVNWLLSELKYQLFNVFIGQWNRYVALTYHWHGELFYRLRSFSGLRAFSLCGLALNSIGVFVENFDTILLLFSRKSCVWAYWRRKTFVHLIHWKSLMTHLDLLLVVISILKQVFVFVKLISWGQYIYSISLFNQHCYQERRRIWYLISHFSSKNSNLPGMAGYRQRLSLKRNVD